MSCRAHGATTDLSWTPGSPSLKLSRPQAQELGVSFTRGRPPTPVAAVSGALAQPPGKEEQGKGSELGSRKSSARKPSVPTQARKGLRLPCDHIL